MPFEEKVLTQFLLTKYQRLKLKCYHCSKPIELALGKTIHYLRARNPRAYCDSCFKLILFEVEDEGES